MKIILDFCDLGKESEDIVIDWIDSIVHDKSCENSTPLRYVNSFEVQERAKKE
jgi:hypothetical protein